jgi:hypothetical protein
MLHDVDGSRHLAAFALIEVITQLVQSAVYDHLVVIS